tara:strand:+ start:19197 stop:19412 length:216 start_codon:yes stop_codon:yes gene_type:complete
MKSFKEFNCGSVNESRFKTSRGNITIFEGIGPNAEKFFISIKGKVVEIPPEEVGPFVDAAKDFEKYYMSMA